MGKVKRASAVAGSLLVVFLVAIATVPVHATTTKSQNYEASETEFGAGAAIDTCSGEYCARASIGLIGGSSSSENFSAAFGSVSEETEPLLELFVEPGKSNLGQLDVNRTATRTMKLHVRSHLAGGYTVQVTGSPPSYEGYTLAVPIAPIGSMQGSEQFALNVVANSSPEVGDDPMLMPEETAVPDVVLSKYSAANLFAYNDGDIIARTESESSQIRYTISMIVNVSGSTPAGHYAGDFSAIVTPVF